MNKEPTEMYQRAKNENRSLMFFKFQAWIRNDLKDSLDKLQLLTNRASVIDEVNGFKIKHLHFNADKTMSGFDETSMASDGVRTKQEAIIDAKHIEKLKKDIIQINSRNSGSIKDRNDMVSGVPMGSITQ